MTQPLGQQNYRPGYYPLFNTPVKFQAGQNPSSPNPNLQKQADPQEPHDKGILALGIIKTLVGGFIVGGTVAITEKQKLLPIVGIDMALGIIETMLASWIIRSNNPIAQRLIEFSSHFSRAPKKPAYQMSNHEKEMALTPISAIASVLSSGLTLLFSKALDKNPRLRAKPVTRQDLEKAKGLDKLFKWPKVKILEIHGKINLPASVKNNVLYKNTIGTKLGKVFIAALAVGALEGILAGHLKRHEEENERKGKKGLTSLF